MHPDKDDQHLREESSPRKLNLDLNTMLFSRKPLTEGETTVIYLFELLNRKFLKNEYVEITNIVKEKFYDDKIFLLAVKEFSELPIYKYPTELILEVIKIKGELKKMILDTSDIKKIIETDRLKRISLRMIEDKIINYQYKLNRKELLILVDEYDIKESESWKSIMILGVELMQLLRM